MFGWVAPLCGSWFALGGMHGDFPWEISQLGHCIEIRIQKKKERKKKPLPTHTHTHQIHQTHTYAQTCTHLYTCTHTYAQACMHASTHTKKTYSWCQVCYSESVSIAPVRVLFLLPWYYLYRSIHRSFFILLLGQLWPSHILGCYAWWDQWGNWKHSVNEKGGLSAQTELQYS